MNTITLVLYIFTWILAVLFFLAWRRARDDAEFLETRGDQWREYCEKAEAALEADKRLLSDPDLRFVGTCAECEKVADKNGEPCKVLLSFDNYTKDNYCSQFKRKDSHGSDLQTTAGAPIPRSARRYEGTLKRIEGERGASVGDCDTDNAETD